MEIKLVRVLGEKKSSNLQSFNVQNLPDRSTSKGRLPCPTATFPPKKSQALSHEYSKCLRVFLQK